MLSATSVAPPQRDEFFLRSDLRLREAELKTLNLPIANVASSSDKLD